MSRKFQAYGSAPAAVLVSAVLLAGAAGVGWQHLSRLRRDFSLVQSENFHLAEHVEERMATLNEALRCLAGHPEPAALADFQRQAGEMKLWIQTNRLGAASGEQRDVLGRLDAALGAYVRKAGALGEENARAGLSVAPRPLLEGVGPEALQILGLGRELRAAEQAALARFVQDSRRSMRNLYIHVVVSVGLALVLGVGALRLIQVARIAPLKAELVQSRSALEQQEKLASLGTLAAGVAHEVHNPLTAIKVRLHGLRRALGDNASAGEDLEVIRAEIERVELIVKDFLQFARPAAPRMQSLAPETLFERVSRLMAAQVEAAGLRWTAEAPPEARVRADPQQIEQVLINLVKNAVENTARGGSITLRAEARQARWPTGIRPATVLEVVDTGKRIAPEMAQRLFEPFYSTKEGGTGLGLSIAARIVERHGGLLDYQTEVGRGTTFRIILPREEGS